MTKQTNIHIQSDQNGTKMQKNCEIPFFHAKYKLSLLLIKQEEELQVKLDVYVANNSTDADGDGVGSGARQPRNLHPALELKARSPPAPAAVAGAINRTETDNSYTTFTDLRYQFSEVGAAVPCVYLYHKKNPKDKFTNFKERQQNLQGNITFATSHEYYCGKSFP